MAAEERSLGDIALNKVVELGINSQLDNVEDLHVDLHSNPLDLIQGKVESIEVSGSGLVTQQDIRMETLLITTERVSIDPLRAVFGNIELTQPTAAEAQIVLTEADINRAFGSDYLRSKLQGLTIDMDGQAVTIDVRQATLNLPGEGKFVLAATFLLREQGEVKSFSATAIPQIDEDGNRIALEILAAEGQGLTFKLVMAIFDQLSVLLDLRNFELPGVALKLHKLEAQLGKLVINATTQISQIPALPL